MIELGATRSTKRSLKTLSANVSVFPVPGPATSHRAGLFEPIASIWAWYSLYPRNFSKASIRVSVLRLATQSRIRSHPIRLLGTKDRSSGKKSPPACGWWAMTHLMFT